jgi:uncharacterized protein YggU (UPF0235/DUF167 family)
VDGVRDGILRARVSAPPVDGDANAALLRLIARELDVPAGAVRIVAGEAARTKRIAVDGISMERLAARWPGLAV